MFQMRFVVFLLRIWDYLQVELLRLWFSHMQEVKPSIYVIYNGDFFDWPFVERRAAHHGLKMRDGTPVSARAVPVEIFETDAEVMKFYVRKWCKVSADVGIRSIVDWSYYKQRLSSAIQKIITIPAAMQKFANPVPRVVHPDWLHKKVREKQDKFRQRKLVDVFNSMNMDELSKKQSNSDNVCHVINEEAINDLVQPFFYLASL
ncbi:hypothetical protein K1719_042922 [Acacia pycnantha]|nr:hypothetical protein K1719_042922 [Acacia pycnantha]